MLRLGGLRVRAGEATRYQLIAKPVSICPHRLLGGGGRGAMSNTVSRRQLAGPRAASPLLPTQRGAFATDEQVRCLAPGDDHIEPLFSLAYQVSELVTRRLLGAEREQGSSAGDKAVGSDEMIPASVVALFLPGSLTTCATGAASGSRVLTRSAATCNS